MSIPRVKGTGWGLNEKLTSAQITLLDQYVSQRALDKTAAGDTLSGLIVVSSSAGFDFQSGSGPIFRSGSFMSFASGATVNLTAGISGATIVAASGITWTIGGAMTIGGTLGVTGLASFGAMNVSGAASFSGTTTLAGTNKLLLGARSIERQCNNMMRTENAATTGQTQLSIPAGDTGDVDLDLPHGATLTDVRIYISGGHTPPAGTKLVLSIIRWDLAGGITVLGTVTDPNTGGTYAGTHSFLASAGGAISSVVDRTQYRYLVSVDGETGSGAGAVLWFRTSAIFTPASYDDGAA